MFLTRGIIKVILYCKYVKDLSGKYSLLHSVKAREVNATLWGLIWGAGERVNTNGDLLNSVKCPCWVNDSLPPQQGFYSRSCSVWATWIMFEWDFLSFTFERSHITQDSNPFSRNTQFRQKSLQLKNEKHFKSTWILAKADAWSESIRSHICITAVPTLAALFLLFLKTVPSDYCLQNLFTGSHAGGTESDSFSTSLHGQQTDLFYSGHSLQVRLCFPIGLWEHTHSAVQHMHIELQSRCLAEICFERCCSTNTCLSRYRWRF